LDELRKVAEAASSDVAWVNVWETGWLVDKPTEVYIATFDPSSVLALLDVVEAALMAELWGWGEPAVPGAVKATKDLRAALSRLDAIEDTTRTQPSESGMNAAT